MTTYSTIELKIQDRIATLWLDRPDVRNAFNGEMITELIDCLTEVGKDERIIALLLRGKGKVFCGGADIGWMSRFSERTYEEDYQSNQQLAQCFHAVYTLPQPTIAVVQGAAFGGANGLLAACDMAYAVEDTTFAFSEVKIGIIPATIAPYVLRRTGEAAARELMLTGRRFDGAEAARVGLVNQCFRTKEDTESRVRDIVAELKTAAPGAVRRCKQLINTVSQVNSVEESIDYTARMIADARAAPEGQEGMRAFLEKRKPDWRDGERD
jgi:methylglutaconyl-CoA hydratase